jgi:uncharacterized membrane protein
MIALALILIAAEELRPRHIDGSLDFPSGLIAAPAALSGGSPGRLAAMLIAIAVSCSLPLLLAAVAVVAIVYC